MNNLLRLPVVLNMTGLARSTLYLRISQGLMPPPVKLGERCVAWPEHEVTAVNAALVAGKSEDEIRQIVTWLQEQRTSATQRAVGGDILSNLTLPREIAGRQIPP